MKSSFPVRYVDKDAPELQGLPRHQIVFVPGQQGSTYNDLRRTADELEAAWEAKNISDTVPEMRANGRELTLEFLKDVVAARISKNDLDWVRGCDSIQIRHHPIKREKWTSVLSSLLMPPQFNDQRKLLSVRHKEDTFVFKVDLLENEYMTQESFVVNLFNEMDPPAIRLVEKGRTDGFRFSHLYGSKEAMEHFALYSLCLDLCSHLGVALEDFKYQHEPLGKCFPDFELIVEEQKWAVEVARVESGMVSYVRVEKPLDERGRNKALQNYKSEDRLGETLRREVNDKAERRAKCSTYSRFCLLLVDIVDSIGDAESAIWNSCDLSAFDAVVTVRLDGSVSYIKNGLTPGR